MMRSAKRVPGIPANRDDKLLAGREVADLLRVHPNTVRIWADKGILPAYRLGPRGDRRFKRKDVLAFLERCRGGDCERSA